MRILLLALTLAACDPSPVAPDRTVRLRGSLSGFRSVEMVNRAGMADRSANADASGVYEFAWAGRDLTGTFGERTFYLRAEENGAWVSSSDFHLREDFQAPLLTIWNPDVAWSRTGNDITARFSPVQGAGCQRIREYRVRIAFRPAGRSTDEDLSIVVPAGGGTVRATGNLPAEIRVRIDAVGEGQPLSLTYHSRDYTCQ